MGRLLTVGHGTASPEELLTLLAGAGIALVVDVRRYPGSRRNPALAREAMRSWMPAAGVEYESGSLGSVVDAGFRRDRTTPWTTGGA